MPHLIIGMHLILKRLEYMLSQWETDNECKATLGNKMGTIEARYRRNDAG